MCSSDLKTTDWNDLTSGSRQVYVHRATLPANGADLDFIAIDGPLGSVGSTDIASAVSHAGQFIPTLLSYSPDWGSGVLCASTRIPLDMVDPANPAALGKMISLVASAAFGFAAESGKPDGVYAARAREIRDSAWRNCAQIIKDDPEFTINRELSNGAGFIFAITGPSGRSYEIFAARQNLGNDSHVTLEYALGQVSNVDLTRAVQAANEMTGGVVCDDGFVTLRTSRSLTSLTADAFKLSVAQLLIAADKYLSAP